jgi:hypothetical protein
MKHTYFACLFLLLNTTFLFSQSNPVSLLNQADPKAQAKILDSYGKLPLSFEANHGQTDSRVKFLSRTGGYTLFLTGDEAMLALSGTKTDDPHKAKIVGAAHSLHSGMAATKAGGVLRMKLRNANPAAKVTGMEQLAGTSNYFIGNDSAKWRTNVPTYAKVKYEGIYSGIDLVYYGNQRQLEYDFVVAPGADPHRIKFDVRGAKRIRRDEHGDLVLKLGDDEIRWHKPVVYQEKDGAKQLIAARYAITEKNRVGFKVAKYDVSRPLYIDPLLYSTYLGGSGVDSGYGIAVDSSGNAYVTGSTTSTDFPTMNPLQPANGGGSDAFVTKINPSGSALVYSTYLGGSGDDWGQGIAVDTSGNAYVTGITTSTDFPTMNPLQAANGGGYDAFVSKINPAGSALVYSTYLGGSGYDSGQGIAVDTSGNAYVTGITVSTNFPVTPGAFQTACGGNCAFVTKFNPSGSALVYSTYLGGSVGYGIAVDTSGNAYVTGYAFSTNFPVTPGAFQTTCCGAFVTKLNPTGTALVYSTYLGGSELDEGYGIAVDSTGNAYVTGNTRSTNFPVTPGAFQTKLRGKYDAFVTKFNPTGSALVYSTYLGGSGGGKGVNWGSGIAVNSPGNASVIGYTSSNNFPITPNAFQHCLAGHTDAFVTKITPSGSALVYSTCLGGSSSQIGLGIALDSAGSAYVTGNTRSTNFPVTPGAFQTACGNPSSCSNAFVTKIEMLAATTTTLTSSSNPSTYEQAVTFTATVASSIGAPPDGETITFEHGTTVLGTGVLSDGSASFTTSTLKVGTTAVTAVYSGDTNFARSTSKAVSQVISKATSMTTLTSSQNPSTYGQPVTFTATVAPEFSGTVTGKVAFYNGTTLLKTVALSGGVAEFTTSTLTSGTYTITATYNGSVDFTGSSASLTQTVD